MCVSPCLDVGAEVVDLLVACVLQVEVSPAEEQLLGGQLHQVLQGLPIPEQSCQGWREEEGGAGRRNERRLVFNYLMFP